jgi:hypothetical protein
MAIRPSDARAGRAGVPGPVGASPIRAEGAGTRHSGGPMSERKKCGDRFWIDAYAYTECAKPKGHRGRHEDDDPFTTSWSDVVIERKPSRTEGA